MGSQAAQTSSPYPLTLPSFSELARLRGAELWERAETTSRRQACSQRVHEGELRRTVLGRRKAGGLKEATK